MVSSSSLWLSSPRYFLLLLHLVLFRNPHAPSESDLSMRVVKSTGGRVPKSDFDLLLTDPGKYKIPTEETKVFSRSRLQSLS